MRLVGQSPLRVLLALLALLALHARLSDDQEMRISILIAATLATSGCGDDSGSCPNNFLEPFTLDEDLSESTIQDLLTEHDLTDPAELDCAAVCESTYYSSLPGRGRFGSADTCTIKTEGYPTGDPEALVGHILCEGKGYSYFCLGGRRPIGHIDQPLNYPNLPAFIAASAHLEAASAVAFTQLAERLQRWEAPASLVKRCRAAAAEEKVHAELLGALAYEAGVNVEPMTETEFPVDLVCAALDNAVEGCVVETWSAVVCSVTASRRGVRRRQQARQRRLPQRLHPRRVRRRHRADGRRGVRRRQRHRR